MLGFASLTASSTALLLLPHPIHLCLCRTSYGHRPRRTPSTTLTNSHFFFSSPHPSHTCIRLQQSDCTANIDPTFTFAFPPPSPPPGRMRRGWYAPPPQYLPEGTKKIDDKACQSPFTGTICVYVVDYIAYTYVFTRGIYACMCIT